MKHFQTCARDEIKQPKEIPDVFPGKLSKKKGSATVSEHEIQQLIRQIERLQTENKELVERTAEVEINRNKAVLERIKLEEEHEQLKRDRDMLIKERSEVDLRVRSSNVGLDDLKNEHQEITADAINKVQELTKLIQAKDDRIRELEDDLDSKILNVQSKLDDALKKKPVQPSESVYDRLYNQKKGQPGSGRKP